MKTTSQHKYLEFGAESWTLKPAEWKEQAQLFLANVLTDIWYHLDQLDDNQRLCVNVKFEVFEE